MQWFELTHRIMGCNAGGYKVETGVVGKTRIWSLADAVELIITGQARFFRADGAEVVALSVLPEWPNLSSRAGP